MFNAEALCDEEIKTRLALARERMGNYWIPYGEVGLSPSLKARLIQTLV